MSIESIHEKAVSNLGKQSTKAFDPAMFSVILELILQLLAAFQDCRKSGQQAYEMAKNPTWLQRRLLMRKVRRELGRREWKASGKEVVNALLETGKQVTPQELQEAMDEL